MNFQKLFFSSNRLLNILILLGFPTSSSIQYIEEAPALISARKNKRKKHGDKKPKFSYLICSKSQNGNEI